MGISVTIYTLGSTTHQGLLSFLAMTPFTGNLIVYTFDSKRTKVVILSDIDGPTIRVMTSLTITAFLAAMNVDMAGFTILWHASVLILHVAFAAFSGLVLTF